MTDQEQKQKDPAATPAPEFPTLDGMGEAGGVAFTTVRLERVLDGGVREVMEINLTGRGRNTREALKNLGDGLRFAEEKGMSSYRRINEAPAKPATPAPGKAPAPGNTPAPAPAKTGTPPPASTEPANGTIHATKLEVAPRPDGKVNLGFFAANHKFADITKICTVEVAIQTLREVGEFTAEHFAAATTYDISANVQWANSAKLNTRGNPYKDIIAVTAA